MTFSYHTGDLSRATDTTSVPLRPGVTGGAFAELAKTLCSTNPCESMIEIVRYTQRNVKRWRGGEMRKRWTAAGMLVAEQQFRRKRLADFRRGSSSPWPDLETRPLAAGWIAASRGGRAK